MIPESELALAILIRAIRDARDNNRHTAPARAWLRSPDAQALAGAFDVDPELLTAYVDSLEPERQPWLPELSRTDRI
jgi:hypothetical protein